MIQKYLKIILLCASIVLISGFLCGCATNKHLEIQQSFKPPINYPGKWIKVGTQRIYVTCGAPDEFPEVQERTTADKIYLSSENFNLTNGFYVLVEKKSSKWYIVDIKSKISPISNMRNIGRKKDNQKLFFVNPNDNIVQPIFPQFFRSNNKCEYDCAFYLDPLLESAWNSMECGCTNSLTKIKFLDSYIPLHMATSVIILGLYTPCTLYIPYTKKLDYNEIKKIIEDTDMINVVRAKAKGIDFYSKPYRALLHGKYLPAKFLSPDLKILSAEPDFHILKAENNGNIKITIRNSGKGTAYGVRLKVISNYKSRGLAFDKIIYIGNIDPGQEKKVYLRIITYRNLKTAIVKMTLKLFEVNGFDSKPAIVIFHTRKFYPPELRLVKWKVQNADGKNTITRGKQINLTVFIKNVGLGCAHNVTPVLNINKDYIFYLGANKVRLKTLKPGETKKATFSFIVASGYNGPKNLPISLSINEQRPEFSVTNQNLYLTLNEKNQTPIKIFNVEPQLAKNDVDIPPKLKKSQKIITQNDLAIVIGIQKYKTLHVAAYSDNDAYTVKRYLKVLGFAPRNINILINSDATLAGIKKSVEAWLKDKATSKSRLFFYYSGHGMTDPEGKQSYIVPYDADPAYVKDTCYPMDRLITFLSRLNIKEIIMVIDSCFSGIGPKSIAPNGARPLVLNIEKFTVPYNMVLLTASKSNQISGVIPKKQHGIFTYYFLKAIKKGKNNIFNIYGYLKPNVENKARDILNRDQTPTIIFSKNSKLKFKLFKK